LCVIARYYLSVEVIVPNRRYHIHVVCAANDQPLVLDRLAIFFQARAFLTYDVSNKLPRAALYGRQCIDACDYALMVVGDSYGTSQSLGVSQMHLSYLSAKAKLKPLLILIKTHNGGTEVSQQLKDFTRIVQKHAKHIYYYDEDTNIEQLLSYACDDIAVNYQVRDGWVRANKKLAKPDSQAIIAQYAAASSTSSSTTIKPDSRSAENGVTAGSLNKPIKLIDAFTIQYSAQAYEDGNLTDITRSLTLTWQQVLQALVKIPATFSSYSLQSCINNLIAAKAEQDIKQEMPNVHAVSRYKIAQNDLNKLQRIMVAANWIQLTTYGTRVSQEMWKTTFYAKSLFAKSQQTMSH
jgi:hypothetical protein